ncbi:MAG TPA: hypothetical protein VJ738_16885 [Steroidobacteraceae bacterium]|nr:hypothetical protein [Steroidobacteraceae bacterium]
MSAVLARLALLLLAALCFLGVALTAVLLWFLEQLAKPLQAANVRCFALIEAIHEREVESRQARPR